MERVLFRPEYFRGTHKENLQRIKNQEVQGGDLVIGLKLACQDLGTAACIHAICRRGETMEELTANAAKHAKEVHGYTDEQLNDPEMQDKIEAAIKED